MVDFWGKNRATLYAAEENATVARYNREVVTLTTIVTVANTYFQVLAAQDELRVARRNLAAAERILTLIKQQFTGGTASQLDVSQQEALVATQRAAIPPLEVTLRQNIAALAVLVARAPANFTVTGGTTDARSWCRASRRACRRNCSIRGRTSARPRRNLHPPISASKPRARRSSRRSS